MQLSLELDPPRERGRKLAEKCVGKAARVSNFDFEGAATFILSWLARFGEQSGEALVDAAVAHGFRAHDARAFGAVFQTLVRRKKIECVSFCIRKKGHGTAGGRIWRLKL